MDGRGRLAEPLKRSRHTGEDGTADAGSQRFRADQTGSLKNSFAPAPVRDPQHLFGWRAAIFFAHRHGLGVVASGLLLALTLGYGAVRGGHVAEVIDGLTNARNAIANAAGFRIATLAIGGQKQVTREEILAIAGITGRASLLFFDVDAARAKLTANPWIADATVLKLYPNRLQITVTEREPFALWQKDGKVSVIAEDGTVLEPYVARRFAAMPLLVGRGAQLRARELITLLDRHPDLRDEVRASILVAERRWNLRLKNGMDVRLPETDVDQAVDELLLLAREKNLFTRDVAAVDLRLPDRVTVRLSDAAAKAREDLVKSKTKKTKGTDI